MNKINKTVLSIIVLFIGYLIVSIISFGTFLQIPIFSGETIMWQSIVEQFTVWIPPLIAITVVFSAITSCSRKKQIVNEQKMVVPGIIFIFLSGLSIGIHAVGQIVTDFIGQNGNSSLYKLSFIFDEYLGHLFLFTITAILFLLVLLEINRGPQKLSNIDKSLLTIFGVFNGLFWGLSGVEGGSMYLLVFPLVVFFLIIIRKILKKHFYKIKDFPFTYYFVISSVVMLLFTFIWVFKNGLLVQPTDLIAI